MRCLALYEKTAKKIFKFWSQLLVDDIQVKYIIELGKKIEENVREIRTITESEKELDLIQTDL